MSKKTFNKPKGIQSLYFLLMFLSGGSLFYINTLPDEQHKLWVMLLLLVVLMYSLLKSTRNWAYDNPKDKEETPENKLEYKDKDIPTLEEMMKKKDKK